MAHRFQFEQAVKILGKLSSEHGGDDIYELREAMESIILDHYPSEPVDAEAILNTLLLNAEAGPRLDGRDLKALLNLKHWCAGLTEQALTGAAPSVAPAPPFA